MVNTAIFSDLDGSLCFHGKIHKINTIGKSKIGNGNGNLIVQDDFSNINREVYDFSNKLYDVYFDIYTEKLCQKLSKKNDFIIVTGARFSTIQSRKKRLGFVNYIIYENGGIILDKNWEKDKVWDERIRPSLNDLEKIINELEKDNWNLDIEGRKTSVRIREKDNKNKSLETLNNKLVLPNTLKKTRNLGSIDIIPKLSGKENAVKYLIEKNKYQSLIGIGDDINDIGMLKLMNKSFVLGNSYREVLDVAKNKNWYVSKKKYFESINEILEIISQDF